jgi:hypothetical protein
VGTLTFDAPTARAESAENVAAARALGKKGVTLARAGKCTEALDPLSRAAELFQAPTILVELGYCRCELGQLVEGTETLNKVVRENLGDAPPAAFVAARERAKKLLAQYQDKVASLVINVRAPEGSRFVVSVDGKEVAAALFGVPRPTDPGAHEVRAEGEGLKPAGESVTLEEGGSGEVALILEAVTPSDVAATPAATDEQPTSEPEERHVQAVLVDDGSPQEEPNLVPAYIGFGVGAVGLAAGTYFGLAAMNAKSDLEGVCRCDSCPSGYDDDISSMTRDANLATIGFGVGLVGLGAGLYFWLTAEPDSSSARNHCTGEPCIIPVVGLNHVGARGVF